MAKRIHHMGMIVSRGEHDEFHQNVPDLNPKQHAALMNRLGITKEQDQAWHRTHLTLGQQRVRGLTHVEPSAISLTFAVEAGLPPSPVQKPFACNTGLCRTAE
jgi:hypothetical protein